ncbi:MULTISPECIES: hypothetical protein [Pseudomonas]|uniref:Uncharacterized protein n=1 Tax=Pseudomonas khavaziana TaxID=2842351 RepID=A0ABZ2DML0_9PSED|nr:hypothetical protein [Pseudomonas sp.]
MTSSIDATLRISTAGGCRKRSRDIWGTEALTTLVIATAKFFYEER